MFIRSMNSSFITLEMSYKELRTITNLLANARKAKEFSELDYKVNAELYTAVTIFGGGRIPKFELKHIKGMQEKAGAEYDR